MRQNTFTDRDSIDPHLPEIGVFVPTRIARPHGRRDGPRPIGRLLGRHPDNVGACLHESRVVTHHRGGRDGLGRRSRAGCRGRRGGRPTTCRQNRNQCHQRSHSDLNRLALHRYRSLLGPAEQTRPPSFAFLRRAPPPATKPPRCRPRRESRQPLLSGRFRMRLCRTP